MTDKIQTKENRSEKTASPKPGLVVAAEQAGAVAANLTGEQLGANRSGSLIDQAICLGDPGLRSAQRQLLAGQIGHTQGNKHLQRVIQLARNNGKTLSRESAAETNPASTLETQPGELIEDSGGSGQANALSMDSLASPSDWNAKSTSGGNGQRGEEKAKEENPAQVEHAPAQAATQAAQTLAGQDPASAQNEPKRSLSASEEENQTSKSAQPQGQQAATEAKTTKPQGTAEFSPSGQPDREGNATSAQKGNQKEAPQGENPSPTNQTAAQEGNKAPAKAEQDPAFQGVVGRVKGASAQQQTHPAASTKAAEAQAAATSPSSEVASQAEARHVGEMEQTETPGFDSAGFKARLMARIQSLAPNSMKEADEFKQGNKLGSVKGDMKGQVDQEKGTSQGPLKEKTQAAPDQSGISPKPVTPLAPVQAGPQPADTGAAGAAPKPKTAAEVEKPIQENSKSIDQQMAEADVSDAQLEKSNEPEFKGALDSKKEAQTQAAQGPQEYRSFEGNRIQQAQTEASGTAQTELQSIHGNRSALLTQVVGQQTGAKTQDESARAKVATDIQQIFSKTKTNVERILSKLDSEVDKAFDEGAEAAKRVFEDLVSARMDAYKEERYSGALGWAKWAKDKLLGMPGEVNAFYSEGRSLYIQKMDSVINNVVAIIARTLSEAKAEVANGKKEIQVYVTRLPSDLRKVGDQAAAEIQDKFSELETSIDAKSNDLVDRLANKYNENLGAIDARIDELKSANQGLVDKAVNAVAGAIKTILQLKDMLLNVLSKAADVVGRIIKDPIGFLGNLIEGIKLGLGNFVTNLPKHLIDGLVGWLTGALGPMGITIPENLFSLEGIFSLVMQILGLTWEAVRAKAVKMLGEPAVKALESGFEIFQILINEGPAGLWKYLKEMFSNLKEMVLDAITDLITTEVVQAGIKWIMGLLTPAGAFIKAAMAIYDIVKFFIEKASAIGDLVNAVVDGMAAIASGSIGGAAKLIENALAKALPILIGFLANLLGIGDLAKKVQHIIEKIREKVDQAIDWVIKKAKAAAGKLLGKFGGKPDNSESSLMKDDPQNDPELSAGQQALLSEEKSQTGTDGVTEEEALAISSKITKEHPIFATITPVPAATTWQYQYTIQRTKAGVVNGKNNRANGKTLVDLKSDLPYEKLDYPPDSLGRAKGPSGHIERCGGEERMYLPDANRGYQEGDQRGHLIGDRFGGANVLTNLVPMSPQLNLSSFKIFENRVAAEFESRTEAGKPFYIYMKVIPKYALSDKNDDASFRPESIEARAEVSTYDDNGKVKTTRFYPTQSFPNPQGQDKEPLVVLSQATTEQLANNIPGIGPSTAKKLQKALTAFGEIKRKSQLGELTQFEGIGQGTIDKLLAKRERNKLKFYEVENQQDD